MNKVTLNARTIGGALIGSEQIEVDAELSFHEMTRTAAYREASARLLQLPDAGYVGVRNDASFGEGPRVTLPGCNDAGETV